MSRIGKKPIPLPANVKYTVQGNTVLVEGPKGKLTAMLPTGIKLEKQDGNLARRAREGRTRRYCMASPARWFRTQSKA